MSGAASQRAIESWQSRSGLVLALDQVTRNEGVGVMSPGVWSLVTTRPALADSSDLFAEHVLSPGSRADDYKLIRGLLREAEATGGLHGATGGDLHYWITHFVKEHDLGIVFTSDTHFQLIAEPRTILKPDISFVAKDRLPNEVWEGVIPIAPDLAIEVASLSNRQAEIIEKVALYLAGGTRLVWVVRPQTQQQTVTVFQPDFPERIVTRDEELDGGEVLPGFRLSLAELFRPPGRFAR